MKLKVMTWLVAVTVVVTAAHSETAMAADGWHTNYDAAKKAAKEEGKVLLIHFYADWCGPCKNMDRTVFSQRDVQRSLSDGIVAVKVNSDRRKDLVRQFGVTSLPTDVFVSADGRQLGKHVGSVGSSSYIARLNRYRVRTPATDTAIAAAPHQTPPTAEAPESQVASQSPAAIERTAAKPVINDNKEAESPAVAVTDKPVKKTTAQTTPATESTARKTVDVAQSKAADSDVAMVEEQQKEKPLVLVIKRNEDGHRVGLAGYSPVALQRSSEWVKGSDEFTHQYGGVTYAFRNQEELELFRKSPGTYIPVLHGYDPVAFQQEVRMKSGALSLGARYKGRMYFFASDANRSRFLQNPQPYTRTFEVTFSTAFAAGPQEAL